MKNTNIINTTTDNINKNIAEIKKCYISIECDNLSEIELINTKFVIDAYCDKLHGYVNTFQLLKTNQVKGQENYIQTTPFEYDWDYINDKLHKVFGWGTTISMLHGEEFEASDYFTDSKNNDTTVHEFNKYLRNIQSGKNEK